MKGNPCERCPFPSVSPLDCIWCLEKALYEEAQEKAKEKDKH